MCKRRVSKRGSSARALALRLRAPMADEGAPRKRKWDMGAPSGAGAPAAPAAAPVAAGAAAQAMALAQARAQAMAAAAAFAARLTGAPAARSLAVAGAESVGQAFDLNSLDAMARGALTKRPVHEEVTRKTGCILHTRRVACGAARSVAAR